MKRRGERRETERRATKKERTETSDSVALCTFMSKNKKGRKKNYRKITLYSVALCTLTHVISWSSRSLSVRQTIDKEIQK